MRKYVQKKELLSGSRGKQNIVITKASDPKIIEILKLALDNGSIVLLENSWEVSESYMLQILRKELSDSNMGSLITFGDSQTGYDENFRIYFFSQLPNPHLKPEVQQLGKVLNFAVTREGLEQQLLQIVC